MATVLGTLMPGGLYGATWEEIDASSAKRRDSKLSQVVIDKDSITRNGEMVAVWFIMTPSSGSGQQYHGEFDCKRRTSRDQGFFLNNDGSRSQYDIPSDSGFTPIPPETASEAVFKYVCGNKWYEFWK